MQSHDRLREIALGIFQGAIFCSVQIEKGDEHLFPMIFMPLGLIDKEQLEELKQRNPAVFWGKVSPHGRSINGYPILFEANPLDHEEWDEVRGMVLKMTEAAKEL